MLSKIANGFYQIVHRIKYVTINEANASLPLQIQWGACGLVMAGNCVIFLTILGFFLIFGGGDDFSWEQW